MVRLADRNSIPDIQFVNKRFEENQRNFICCKVFLYSNLVFITQKSKPPPASKSHVEGHEFHNSIRVYNLSMKCQK